MAARGSDGDDDQRGWRALAGDEGRAHRIAVDSQLFAYPDVGIGQERSIKHHVRRKGHDLTLGIRREILRREHVVDADARRNLENPLCEGVGDELLDLLWAFTLSAEFRDLEVARKDRA